METDTVKFEYRVVDSRISETTPQRLEQFLNDLGDDGWELVATCGTYGQMFVFVRSAQEPEPTATPKKRASK